MYRVTVESEDTYLLVMRNMFSHRLHVHRKYDLKVNLARLCGILNCLLLFLLGTTLEAHAVYRNEVCSNFKLTKDISHDKV